jgi:hypothetical protein
MTFDKSSAERSMSPGWTSTPNFAARSFIYFYFLILPIFAIVPCKSASAPKFGISPISLFYCAIFWSVALIPSSIPFCRAAIFAFTSSTVSSWPSSAGSSWTHSWAGVLASSSYYWAIFCSTAASPASSWAYSSAACCLASSTV